MLKNLRIQYRFDRAMRRALFGKKGSGLTADNINDIFIGLGDDSLRAEDPFVTTVLESAREAQGPILQCGSNPLTLLLAIIAQHRSQFLWTLDHNTSSANIYRSLLERYDIRAGKLLCAPAEAFGDHLFYVMDYKRLPNNIELVICDGSNVLPNGLRGVVRRIDAQLSHRCVFLVRNTRRPKDLDFAAKWAKEKNAPFVVNDRAEPFVKVALRDQTEAADLMADRVLTVWGGSAEPEELLKPGGRLASSARPDKPLELETARGKRPGRSRPKSEQVKPNVEKPPQLAVPKAAKV